MHGGAIHALGHVAQVLLFGAEAVHDLIRGLGRGAGRARLTLEGLEDGFAHTAVQVVACVGQQLARAGDVDGCLLAILGDRLELFAVGRL